MHSLEDFIIGLYVWSMLLLAVIASVWKIEALGYIGIGIAFICFLGCVVQQYLRRKYMSKILASKPAGLKRGRKPGQKNKSLGEPGQTAILTDIDKPLPF